MPINPMIYRVFLQDEKDAPNPTKNPEDHFRISYGKFLAWYYTNPNWKPTLEEQLKRMRSYSVGQSTESLNEHLLVRFNGRLTDIVHSPEEIPNNAYELAKKEAEDLASSLSQKNGKPYILIDLTSRGDRKEAERLAEIVSNEEV